MAFGVGDYVKQSSQSQWGIGRVISIGENEKVRIFFLRGGRHVLLSSSPQLQQVEDPHDPILEIVGTSNWHNAHHNLYVIELYRGT